MGAPTCAIGEGDTLATPGMTGRYDREVRLGITRRGTLGMTGNYASRKAALFCSMVR